MIQSQTVLGLQGEKLFRPFVNIWMIMGMMLELTSHGLVLNQNLTGTNIMDDCSPSPVVIRTNEIGTSGELSFFNIVARC